jgi:hypothetical protein
MTDRPELPELPLMLSGIPRGVEELLREAGLPVAALPRETLSAAGCGRFVLFDSGNSGSVRRAQAAASQGLTLIDGRTLWGGMARLEPCPCDVPFSDRHWSLQARLFLDKLREALEVRGGIWARLADFPFPYQSAIGIGVVHHSAELEQFRSVVELLGNRVTHFVPTRLREEKLAQLALAGQADLGWSIGAEDCRLWARSTLSHWRTRLKRFHAEGISPRGLAYQAPSLAVPPLGSLVHLGFDYSCEQGGRSGCATVACIPRAPRELFARISAVPMPASARMLEWIAEHYQSGIPLFICDCTSRLELLRELVQLAADAARCSLMWPATFGRFARWWMDRRGVRMQVWRRAEGIELHADHLPTGFTPAVEIWRGAHLAVLPLRDEVLRVNVAGLLYASGMARHAAGCAARPELVCDARWAGLAEDIGPERPSRS